MKNAQRPDKTSLGSLLKELKDGRYVIPDFQREFEWAPWDVRDLVKSIFLDYYIGSLLLWKGKEKSFKDLSCEPIYGMTESRKSEYIVLDGQQRLTAMYYAFVAPDKFFPKRKSACLFFMKIDKFIDEQYDEAFSYEWISKKWKHIFDNPEEQYKRHLFPIALMGEGGREVMTWFAGYKEYWQYQLDMEIKKIDTDSSDESTADLIQNQYLSTLEKYIKNSKIMDDSIYELSTDYQISYIELNQEISVDKVCDIFTQINSRGVRLDIFDLLNAMLKPKGVQLKTMWRLASEKLDFPETEKMNIYVLQVMSILLQSYCSSKYLYFLIPESTKSIRKDNGEKDQIVLVANSQEFSDKWDEAVTTLQKSIKMLRNPRDFGAIIPTFTPYPSMLPVFSAVRSYIDGRQELNQKQVKLKIRKWYWTSIFANRYSSSVESTSAKDFSDLKNWFSDDDAEPDFISDLPETIQSLNLYKEVKKGSAIYNAIFNMFVIKGAKDFASYDKPEYDDIDDHHIVPASWGKETVGNEINSILNRTPLTVDTNRKILRDKLPNIYLKEMFEKADNDDEVYETLESHFISRNAVSILLRKDFGVEDYSEFLKERNKSLTQGIQTFLLSEAVHIEPVIPELNNAIEQIELDIRKVIIDTLGENPSAIPVHITANPLKRIAGILKRDATKQSSDFQTLSSIIEYFDLRELENVIISKTLWPEFIGLFANKDIFCNKISQLAELRNGIRHSRTFDDITMKEGEAAILWFNKLFST